LQNGEAELAESVLNFYEKKYIVDKETFYELKTKLAYYSQNIQYLRPLIRKMEKELTKTDKIAKLKVYEKILTEDFSINQNICNELDILNNKENCNNIIFLLYINDKIEIIKQILDYGNNYKTKNIVKFYYILLCEFNRFKLINKDIKHFLHTTTLKFLKIIIILKY
jgi:hypothetical protein